MHSQYLDQIFRMLNLTGGIRHVSVNRFEDKYFICGLIRKPVPLLFFVELYHAVLSDIIWIDDIRRDQVRVINTDGITYSKRPVCDGGSKRSPDTATGFSAFDQEWICRTVLT